MSKEHKKRTPVFVSAKEPVGQTLPDSIEDIIGTAPLQEPVFQVEATTIPAPEPVSKHTQETLPNGWHVLSHDQQDGKTYLVTSDFSSEGVRAFWRKTRVLSHNRWIMNGKWSDSLTRADILPIPLYYKEV